MKCKNIRIFVTVSAILAMALLYNIMAGTTVMAGRQDTTVEVDVDDRQSDTETIGGNNNVDSSNTIAYSRDVGTIVTTVQNALDNLGPIIDAPAIRTGSVTFEATAGSVRDQLNNIAKTDPGATIWLNVGYAQNAGNVDLLDSDGNKVRTKAVNAGDILGPVAIGSPDSWGATGIKDANAAQTIMDSLNRMGIDTSNIITQSLADTLADYNRLVAQGIRRDALDDGSWMFIDQLQKILKDLTEPEKKQLLEDLCEILENCDPDTPEDDSPPGDARCHLKHYWGDTIGEVSVQNITTNTGWQTGGTVWARPGDSVQFMTYYCWGAEAVYADDYKYARTEYWAGADNIYFKLSATKNDNYLFGENAQFIGSKKHILSSPHKETIGSATGGEVPNSKVDTTGGYEFTLYSPGQKDADKYNCMIFDFAPHFLGFGYQIPGVDTGSCAAISMNGDNMSDLDNSPGVISQTIEYHKIQAWQLYKYEKSGSCASCNYDDRGNVTDSRTADERNSLKRKNTNIFDDPFPDLGTAKTAPGNTWGIVLKHQDDTEEHEHDCDSNKCGCNKWHHLVTNGCTKCKDDDCKLKVLEDCWLDCGVDDSGAACYSWPGQNYYASKATTYTEHLAKDIHPIDLGLESSTASVNVPYSYYTAANSYLNEGEVVYLGQTATSTFTVNIIPRIVKEVRLNEAYATLVPGFIQAVEFITENIPDNGKVAPVPVAGDDLCNYFSTAEECKEVWYEGGHPNDRKNSKLNIEGRYNGVSYSHQSLRAIPDDRSDLVGKKYCVAVGISTADSHGVVSGDPVNGMSNPSAWRISGLSCRTIAKKPNFQVWNGGLYTNGSIKTSATHKRVGVSLGGDTDPDGVFGSWEEYYVVAAGEVRNFASAAALGYYPSLRPRGGKDPADLDSYCDATKKTISNTNCDKGVSGKSNIANTSQNIILERIRTRYALAPSGGTDYYGNKLDEGGARYIYKQSDNVSISEIVNHFKDANMSNKDSDIYKCNLYNNRKGALKMCQGKSANSEQTTSNYADGTLVIHTGGKVTIDRNICYGGYVYDYCSNGTDDTVKLANNSETFTSMYGLPQVLIIADKGIDITENVSQIDAWLITNGAIDTCAKYDNSNPNKNIYSIGSDDASSEHCKNTLIVNGPVFANSMSLNRTAGANPGAGTTSGTVLTRNLSDLGSVTAAEIFNLRPDALYWAYSQAQRFTQATVTYTRELAPRY